MSAPGPVATPSDVGKRLAITVECKSLYGRPTWCVTAERPDGAGIIMHSPSLDRAMGDAMRRWREWPVCGAI